MFRKDTQAEIRILAAPLSAVMIAYALSLGTRQWLWRDAIDLVYLVGIPFLAGYSWGYEFQSKTISLLLSQPVERMALWWQKSRLSGIAAIIASVPYLLYVIDSSYGQFAPDRWYNVLHNGSHVILYVLMITCSAVFWTLVTRSIVGATALNLISVVLVSIGIELVGWSANGVAAVCTKLGYAVVTIWLGRRTLAAFEVAGEWSGTDLLTQPRWIPSGIVAWLRCRPNQLYLNLIRKELGMLKPVWAVAGLFVLGWLALGVWFSNVSDDIRAHGLPLVLYSMLYAAFMIATTLTAGTISLGEERDSGIHSWHLTLPISAGLHWLIKLVMALAVSSLCLLLVPATIYLGNSLFGSAYSELFSGYHWGSLLWIPALCILAFWCASAVKGTMRATLFAFPAAGAIFLAGGVVWDWVLLRRSGFREIVFSSSVHTVARHQLSPFTFAFLKRFDPFLVSEILLAVSLLGLALIQSCRWFHWQVPDSISWAVKRLLVLCLAAFLSCSVPLFVAANFSQEPASYLIYETVWALKYVRPVMASPQAPPSIQMTVDDFPVVLPVQPGGQSYGLPGLIAADTRTWLRGATLSLIRDPVDLEQYRVLPSLAPEFIPYTLQIHLLHGTTCTFRLSYNNQDSIFQFHKTLDRSDCH